MAERSGFFTAIKNDGVWDRTYNSDDYCNNLAVVISNGVLRSENNDLKVSASGMVLTVNPGRGWIKGHWYINDTPIALSAIVPPSGGSRIDRVMLRFDKNLLQRTIKIVYVQGVAANDPVAPSPTRTELIHDLVLADVYVSANATSVSVVDRRDDTNLCGWVYSVSGDNSFFEALDDNFYSWFQERKDTLSSVTLFKRYSWSEVLSASTSVVQFNIPQYDPDTCFVEVYVNGIFDTRHSVEDNVITFVGTLVAGTVVTVNAYKSLDGTGIESVADEITELQNKVATLEGASKYVYKCTGLDDNKSLSQIAIALVRGIYDPDELTPSALAFMQSFGNPGYLSLNAQVEIKIVGSFGATSAYSGEGTSLSPYKWIVTDNANGSVSRTVIFDFASCEKISIECPEGSTNSIFYGEKINVRNANIEVNGVEGQNFVIVFDCFGKKLNAVNVENCKINIDISDWCRIAEHGTFTNCEAMLVSRYNAAYCFKPKSAGLIRVIGGTYRAYGTTASGISSAIIHTSASETDAVFLGYNMHCPISTEGTYTQGFLSVANAGKTYINGVVTRLTSSGSYNEIIGQINKNKA